jgi:hypothetical protein
MKQYVGTSLKLVIRPSRLIAIVMDYNGYVLTYSRETDLSYFCYGPTLNNFCLIDGYLTPILTA